jgi:hypothetical protein
MGNLLTYKQINFMKGGSIMHGFHYAKEVMQSAIKEKF